MLLKAIGKAHTPYQTLAQCPGNSGGPVEGKLEVAPEYVDALDGIEAASHLIVLYWMGEADRSSLRRGTRLDGRVRGVFANRSPARPNPIGVAVVKLVRREGGILTVTGLDCLDGTDLLDLKPYIAFLDAVATAAIDWAIAPASRDDRKMQ